MPKFLLYFIIPYIWEADRIRLKKETRGSTCPQIYTYLLVEDAQARVNAGQVYGGSATLNLNPEIPAHSPLWARSK